MSKAKSNGLKLEVGKKYYDNARDVFEVRGTAKRGRRTVFTGQYQNPAYRDIDLKFCQDGKNADPSDYINLVSEVETSEVEPKKPALKLRVGGYYLNRVGKIVGPLKEGDTIDDYPFEDARDSWTESGLYFYGEENSADLIQEVTVTPIFQKLQLEIGKSYRTRDGKSVVKIDGPCSRYSGGGYAFEGDNECLYGPHGEFYPGEEDHEDLVEEVAPVEPEPKSKLYYVRVQFSVKAKSETGAREIVMTCIDDSYLEDDSVEITDVIED